MSYFPPAAFALMKTLGTGTFLVLHPTVMRRILLTVALLAVTVASFGADDPAESVGENGQAAAEDGARRAEACLSGRWTQAPICLSANQMSIATGQPSLVNMSSGSTYVRYGRFPAARWGSRLPDSWQVCPVSAPP